METFNRVSDLRNWIQQRRSEGFTIGFIPTMGALHAGHLSLVEASIGNGDYTIVSIYVNPRQFNDPDDLQKYPRPIEEDIRLLVETGTSVLFLPDDNDIYPAGDSSSIDFDPGYVAEVMEGKFRQGHFKGMAEVVYRLLMIVQPDKLYMGQKDFQQLTIVRKLIHDFRLPVMLEMGQTVREPNGLAMSSRNVRLSEEARTKSAIIYSTLMESKRMFEEDDPIESIKEKALQALSLYEGFDPEYFEIVDGITFRDIQSRHDSQFVVALTAVKVEGIRLIDNMIWTRSE